MATLIIDEVEVTVQDEMTVLEAAQQADIHIPHVCSHPDLPPVEQLSPAKVVYRGGKRLENKRPDLVYEGCELCVVEIEGREGLQRACNTHVADGMVVRTATPEVEESRRDRLMVLLAKHPHTCLTCAQKEGCARFPCSMNIPENERCCPLFGRCEFQRVAEYVGIKPETPRYVFEDVPVLKDEPLFERDYNLCIGCNRCIRVCREIRGVEALDFVFDEEGHVLVGTVSPTLGQSACRFCTACVEVCPTGSLMDGKPFEDEAPCRSTCPVEIDVPRYVKLIAEGRFDESYAVIRERLPLPSVCSYICLSFCESECRRGEVNEPIGIRALKRFVSENHTGLWKRNLKAPTSTGKKVAILGSGPAGLTAGYYLARKGHGVTIFEQSRLPGGMLRQAVSRKRLPKKALEEDIEEILQAGVNLELNSPKMQIGELLEQGFDAVFLATGSTFVGPPGSFLEEGSELNPWGSIKADPTSLATSREGVFAGGDAVLGGICEDFIRSAGGGSRGDFFTLLVEQLTSYRGDSSRSAIGAVASGRKAAESIDRYLGGDGVIDEPLLPAEERNHWLGREEGFADLKRLPAPYQPPPPQFAGMSNAEPPLSQEEAMAEARRCFRCDLRLLLSKPIFPPRKKLWIEFTKENVEGVPEVEGVYQLLDEQETVIYIKGAMNLHSEIEEQLEVNEKARYFMYDEEPMYTKRESELLQQFITEYGEMPEGNRELDDLF